MNDLRLSDLVRRRISINEPSVKRKVDGKKMRSTFSTQVWFAAFSLFLLAGCANSSRATKPVVAIRAGQVSFSLSLPQGWSIDAHPRDYPGLNTLICPTGSAWKDSVSKIWVVFGPTEGKKVSPIFDTDEDIKTLDGSKALIRYYRGSVFSSVIILSAPSTPGAVAYIQEGDELIEIVVQSDDDHFEDAKKIFKQVVASYTKSPNRKKG